MKINHTLLALAAFSALAAVTSQGATLIPIGTYTQSFDTIVTGLPADWTVRSGATATAVGTALTFTTPPTTWADTGGRFKNVSSATNLTSVASTTDQGNSSNRALGLRQSGSFGDSGASFNFNFSTTEREITGITLDLMMLSVQNRSTTFTLQYGIGASPTSYTTLSTYGDPGVFGTTSLSFGTTDFGTALNNQAEVVFRVVALGGSTGSGSRDTVGIDNFTITAIPEPSSALLGGLGLLALLRRRR